MKVEKRESKHGERFDIELGDHIHVYTRTETEALFGALKKALAPRVGNECTTCGYLPCLCDQQ